MTAQLRATLPLNPFTGLTVMIEEEPPPGATASGSKDVVVSVNSLVPCPRADSVNVEHATNRPNAHTVTVLRRSATLRIVQSFTWESEHWDLNMSRCKFNYVRFLGLLKRCPHA